MIRRSATPADAEAVVALFRAYDLVEHGESDIDLDDVRALLTPAGTDSVLVEDDGRFVGLACVAANGEVESLVDPVVGNDLHRDLLAWIVERARARGIARLEHWAGTRADGAARLLSEAGFAHARTVWKMRRELTGELPTPVWPAGVQVVPFDDPHAVWELVMRGFAGAFGSHQRPYDEWALHALGTDRSAICAAQDGVLVGVATTALRAGDGYVGQLTVAPEHRGRGIALALLHETFRRDAARGLPATQLGVDGENEGARRLYDKAGMSVVGEYRRWERDV
ncbi:MAG: GNAT family N-acetyltransferase [Mycobacteriales bacterium]